MKLEVIIHKITHSNDHYGQRTLVDHFCLMDGSEKQPTRTRIKKLLRRTFPRMFRWVSFVHKDEHGHYHTTQSGPRAQAPYHFWWYHFEIIPCQNSTKTNASAITAKQTPDISAKIAVTNEILHGITKNALNVITAATD